MFSDDDLRTLSKDEIDDLQQRLAQVVGDLPSLTAGNEKRRRFVAIMTISTLGLIPWVIALAVTLPKHYIAGHWTLTWVGFDLGLLTSLGLTAYLAWRRRQAVIGLTFICAAALTCDAWFDITTSSGTIDVTVAIISAALLELPLAAMLLTVGHHLVRAATDQARTSELGSPPPTGWFTAPLFGVPERPPAPTPS
jgi:hypothetical protein